MNYSILTNINLNFHKLFYKCINGYIYTPLLFENSDDIEVLLLLNQIIEIKINKNKGIRDIICIEILENIIRIKCREFCIKYNYYNIESFTNSLHVYINNIIKGYEIKYSEDTIMD